MQLSDFDFELPPDRIARFPVSPRDQSRLLIVDRKTGLTQGKHFFDLPEFLRTGDLLVLNESKVLPARLESHADEKQKEILLLQKSNHSSLIWTCLAKGCGKCSVLQFENGITGRVVRLDEGYQVTFEGIEESKFFAWLERVGQPPLPPYLKRSAKPSDRETYQTVFAKSLGSVAAPTAGLHFTEALLRKVQNLGIELVKVTLHVGYGTFAPIRASNLEDHQMHEETYEISDAAWSQLQAAKKEGRRIIPVGTTALRSLESIPFTGLRGSTKLFIRPGFHFQWANGLITNFHTPKSSLLVLVCALLGRERTLEIYKSAMTEGYRFYSYGDAMAIF